MPTDQKISQLSSGAPAQAGDEYVVARSGANYKLTLTNIAGAMPAITTTGTVTVSGTGLKFNADFSNATAANRFAFQSSTTDAVTRVPAIPNGTGTTATWQAFNSSTMNNCANIQFGVDSTSAFFSTAVVGSGTAVPFNFNLGGTTRMSITTAGLVGIANASPIVNLEVGSSNETPKAIGVRHGTVPAYVANSFDGTNALGTFSCNIYDTSSGSQSWSAFGSATYGAAAVQVVGSTTGSEVRVLTASAANTNPTVRMRINSAGNAGLGVTPKTWFGNSNVLQFGSGGALEGRSNLPNLVQLLANAYLDSSGVTKYINSAAASSYLQYLGQHSWYTAASGTADNAVSFTQAMTLTTGGNLLVGTTTDVSGLSGVISDVNGNVRAIPQSGAAKTGSYTLVKGDVGEFINVGSGGSIVVPDSVFATGDVVSVFNNTSGNITMTMSITTAYIGGTDADKATITVATRGVATILFISGTVCVVNGNVS